MFILQWVRKEVKGLQNVVKRKLANRWRRRLTTWTNYLEIVLLLFVRPELLFYNDYKNLMLIEVRRVALDGLDRDFEKAIRKLPQNSRIAVVQDVAGIDEEDAEIWKHISISDIGICEKEQPLKLPCFQKRLLIVCSWFFSFLFFEKFWKNIIILILNLKFIDLTWFCEISQRQFV